MKESDIEKYVKEKLKSRGYVLKWVAPGESGVPDRLVVTSRGIEAVEFKKPGGRLSARQKLWIRRFKVLGQEIRVINNMEEAKDYVEEVCATSLPK